MKTTFKSKLLLGAAVTALSFGVAGVAHADTFGSSGDDGLYNDGNIDGSGAAGVDIGALEDMDLQVQADGETIWFVDGDTLGDEAGNTIAAILPNATGYTLTLTQDVGTDDDALLTGHINGSVTTGGFASFNLSIDATPADGANGAEHVLIEMDGADDDISLGTGTLRIESSSAKAGDSDAALNIAGDITAGSIVLDSDSGNGGNATDAALALDGAANQTVTGAITAALDGEGEISVSNTVGKTATFASQIGTNDVRVGILNVGAGAADATNGLAKGGGNTAFSGDVFADDINIGFADTGNEAVVADFNGNVAFTTMDIISDTTGDVTISGNSTGGDITMDDGATAVTLTFDGSTAQTVTSTINGQATQDGQVYVGTTTVNSDVTFTGLIGANGTTGIELFSVRSGSTATLDDNDVYTDSAAAGTAGINVASGATLNVQADDGDTIINEVTGDMNFAGTLNVTGDNNVSFTGDDEIYIDGTFNTSLTSSKTTTIDTDDEDLKFASVSDTTITAANQIVVATAGAGDDLLISDASGKTLTVYAKKVDGGYAPTSEANALIAADGLTGTVIIDETGTAQFGIADTSAEFDAGDSIWFIDGNSAVQGVTAGATTYTALIASGDVVLLDNGLVTLSHDTTSTVAQDLVATVGFKDATSTFTAGAVGGTAANELLSNITTAQTTGELQTIRGNLIGAATTEAAEEIAESITSTVDGGNVAGAMTVSTQSSNVVNTRMASLSNGETGMTAGNISQGLKVWAQGFGTTGEQDRRDGVDGFDVDTYGLAVGIDTETLADNWIWGLAFSYADSEVDSKNANRTNTEIDSYQFTLYANYDWDDATYISGQLAYAFADNDTIRHDVGGITGLNASGDFDSDTFSARMEAGRSYEVGSNTTLTPKALVNYMHYDADSYTETGAGTANLNVDQDDLNVFELGVGVDASWMYQQADGGYLQPVLSVGVRHDLVGDEVESTNSFTGAGGTFNTQGFDPAQTTFNAGAGITYYSTTNWELSAEYDFEYKSDYDAHSGLVRAAYKF